LKEEQDRQMRLNQQNNRSNMNNSHEKSLNNAQLEPKQEPLIELYSSQSMLNKSSDNSVCIISDDETSYKECKTEANIPKLNEITEKICQPDQLKLAKYHIVNSAMTNKHNLTSNEDDNDEAAACAKLDFPLTPHTSPIAGGRSARLRPC